MGGMDVVVRGGEQADTHMAIAAKEQRALNGNGEGKAKAGTNATARAGIVREKLHFRRRVSTAQNFSVDVSLKKSPDAGAIDMDQTSGAMRIP